MFAFLFLDYAKVPQRNQISDVRSFVPFVVVICGCHFPRLSKNISKLCPWALTVSQLYFKRLLWTWITRCGGCGLCLNLFTPSCSVPTQYLHAHPFLQCSIFCLFDASDVLCSGDSAGVKQSSVNNKKKVLHISTIVNQSFDDCFLQF